MRPQDLVVGKCYFNLGYATSDARPLQYPLIDTMVYCGPEELDDGRMVWSFRIVDGDDAEAADGDRGDLIVYDDGSLPMVCSLAEMLSELSQLLNHDLHRDKPRSTASSPEALSGWKATIVWLNRLVDVATDLRSVMVAPRYGPAIATFEVAPDSGLCLNVQFRTIADDEVRRSFQDLAEANGWNLTRERSKDWGRMHSVSYKLPDDVPPETVLRAILSDICLLSTDDELYALATTSDGRLLDTEGREVVFEGPTFVDGVQIDNRPASRTAQQEDED